MPNVPELKAKVISILQRNGPSLPVKISKGIEENMIFAGAVLSELASNKKVLISNAKIGNSPVYYLPGQEYRLSQVLYPYLKDIYKKAHDLIKRKIILRDKELEPWQRASLRESKDFAVMLNVTNGDIFWKWYMTSNQEAEILIKKHLGIKEEPKEEIPQPIKQEPVKQEVEIPKPIKEEIELPQPKPPSKDIEKPKEKQQILKKELDLGILTDHFSEKEITISNQEQISKKEINFNGEMNSKLGLMKMFIKFKDKKRVSDSDLITAHNEAKKLPLYFLSTGNLTKKAQKYIEDNFLLFEKLK